MKFIKLFTATFIAIFSLSNITLADSILNEILSSGKLKAGTTGDFNPIFLKILPIQMECKDHKKNFYMVGLLVMVI